MEPKFREESKMCRHCERIVEDAEYKPIVHKFMKGLTKGINRALAERGEKFSVTVDEVEFYSTVPNKVAAKIPMMSQAVLRLLYKDLMDAVK
jgi:hypothetical protein